MTTKAPIKNEFEYKGPTIHVQVSLFVVQPDVQCQNQGYLPGMPLAYPEASSSTIVSPQYAYTRAPYVPFGVQYGQTFNQIVNHGLVHYAQMFPLVATPQIHSILQVPLVPMPYYSFPQVIASQYQ